MDSMHLKQILSILGSFLLWTCAARSCYSEEKLEEEAMRRLRSHYWQLHEPSVTQGPTSCPVEMFSQPPVNRNFNSRSLSPWIYQNVSMADHFPSSYVQAVCLCRGCIQFKDGKASQSDDLNSVPVVQSRFFLKREYCGGQRSYRLIATAVDVAVACTCVRPMTGS